MRQINTLELLNGDDLLSRLSELRKGLSIRFSRSLLLLSLAFVPLLGFESRADGASGEADEGSESGAVGDAGTIGVVKTIDEEETLVTTVTYGGPKVQLSLSKIGDYGTEDGSNVIAFTVSGAAGDEVVLPTSVAWVRSVSSNNYVYTYVGDVDGDSVDETVRITVADDITSTTDDIEVGGFYYTEASGERVFYYNSVMNDLADASRLYGFGVVAGDVSELTIRGDGTNFDIFNLKGGWLSSSDVDGAFYVKNAGNVDSDSADELVVLRFDGNARVNGLSTDSRGIVSGGFSIQDSGGGIFSYTHFAKPDLAEILHVAEQNAEHEFEITLVGRNTDAKSIRLPDGTWQRVLDYDVDGNSVYQANVGDVDGDSTDETMIIKISAMTVVHANDGSVISPSFRVVNGEVVLPRIFDFSSGSPVSPVNDYWEQTISGAVATYTHSEGDTFNVATGTNVGGLYYVTESGARVFEFDSLESVFGRFNPVSLAALADSTGEDLAITVRGTSSDTMILAGEWSESTNSDGNKVYSNNIDYSTPDLNDVAAKSTVITAIGTGFKVEVGMVIPGSTPSPAPDNRDSSSQGPSGQSQNAPAPQPQEAFAEVDEGAVGESGESQNAPVSGSSSGVPSWLRGRPDVGLSTSNDPSNTAGSDRYPTINEITSAATQDDATHTYNLAITGHSGDEFHLPRDVRGVPVVNTIHSELDAITWVRTSADDGSGNSVYTANIGDFDRTDDDDEIVVLTIDNRLDIRGLYQLPGATAGHFTFNGDSVALTQWQVLDLSILPPTTSAWRIYIDGEAGAVVDLPLVGVVNPRAWQIGTATADDNVYSRQFNLGTSFINIDKSLEVSAVPSDSVDRVFPPRTLEDYSAIIGDTNAGSYEVTLAGETIFLPEGVIVLQQARGGHYFYRYDFNGNGTDQRLNFAPQPRGGVFVEGLFHPDGEADDSKVTINGRATVSTDGIRDYLGTDNAEHQFIISLSNDEVHTNPVDAADTFVLPDSDGDWVLTSTDDTAGNSTFTSNIGNVDSDTAEETVVIIIENDINVDGLYKSSTSGNAYVSVGSNNVVHPTSALLASLTQDSSHMYNLALTGDAGDAIGLAGGVWTQTDADDNDAAAGGNSVYQINLGNVDSDSADEALVVTIDNALSINSLFKTSTGGEDFYFHGDEVRLSLSKIANLVEQSADNKYSISINGDAGDKVFLPFDPDEYWTTTAGTGETTYTNENMEITIANGLDVVGNVVSTFAFSDNTAPLTLSARDITRATAPDSNGNFAAMLAGTDQNTLTLSGGLWIQTSTDGTNRVLEQTLPIDANEDDALDKVILTVDEDVNINGVTVTASDAKVISFAAYATLTGTTDGGDQTLTFVGPTNQYVRFTVNDLLRVVDAHDSTGDIEVTIAGNNIGKVILPSGGWTLTEETDGTTMVTTSTFTRNYDLDGDPSTMNDRVDLVINLEGLAYQANTSPPAGLFLGGSSSRHTDNFRDFWPFGEIRDDNRDFSYTPSDESQASGQSQNAPAPQQTQEAFAEVDEGSESGAVGEQNPPFTFTNNALTLRASHIITSSTNAAANMHEVTITGMNADILTLAGLWIQTDAGGSGNAQYTKTIADRNSDGTAETLIVNVSPAVTIDVLGGPVDASSGRPLPDNRAAYATQTGDTLTFEGTNNVAILSVEDLMQAVDQENDSFALTIAGDLFAVILTPLASPITFTRTTDGSGNNIFRGNIGSVDGDLADEMLVLTIDDGITFADYIAPPPVPTYSAPTRGIQNNDRLILQDGRYLTNTNQNEATDTYEAVFNDATDGDGMAGTLTFQSGQLWIQTDAGSTGANAVYTRHLGDIDMEPTRVNGVITGYETIDGGQKETAVITVDKDITIASSALNHVPFATLSGNTITYADKDKISNLFLRELINVVDQDEASDTFAVTIAGELEGFVLPDLPNSEKWAVVRGNDNSMFTGSVGDIDGDSMNEILVITMDNGIAFKGNLADRGQLVETSANQYTYSSTNSGFLFSPVPDNNNDFGWVEENEEDNDPVGESAPTSYSDPVEAFLNSFDSADIG